VPLKELNVSRLSLLLDHVLNDPIYRDNARYIQEAIAKTDGLSKAADLLERAFGFLSRPEVVSSVAAIQAAPITSEPLG
jgi:hypothetical protein